MNWTCSRLKNESPMQMCTKIQHLDLASENLSKQEGLKLHLKER